MRRASSTIDSSRRGAILAAMKSPLAAAAVAVLLGTACTDSEVRSGPKPPPAAAEWAAADPADIDFTSRAVPGGLEILEKDKPVSRIMSARPVVERTAFVKEGRQFIVRSRAADPMAGPAIIELFDSRSGTRRAVIGANEIFHGRPAWAAAFADPLR